MPKTSRKNILNFTSLFIAKDIKLFPFIAMFGVASLMHFSVQAETSTVENENYQKASVLYTLPQEYSLYQLALQSGITVQQLRDLNEGNLKQRSYLNAGEKLLLPANSKLVKSNVIDVTQNAINLPVLGSDSGKQQEDKNVLLSEAGELTNSIVQKTPLSPLIADSNEERLAKTAMYAKDKGWENFDVDQIGKDAETWAKNRVESAILEPVQKGANELLGKFGKGQATISIDENGSLKGSSFSLLSPLYDNNESLIFAQSGVHQQGSGEEERLIGNFGLGYRYDNDSYLAGINAFYDYDFTGYNSRLGLGGELWMDYLKLSTNYYMPLSDWRDSKVLDGYEERAARGFDIRAQGYLPAYPQLGASAVFEQYYGDQVALFGLDNRQKNPYAGTLGVDYTPFPLLTLKASQKFGKEGKTDTRLDLNLNVQIGKSIEEQLDPANVAASRSLKGSRYDLVDRNYDIVFEYREKPKPVLKLADEIILEYTSEALEIQNSVYSAPANVHWQLKYQGIPVDADQFISFEQGDWNFNAPDWKRSSDPEVNKYYVTMTINLPTGEEISSNEAVVTVVPDRGGFLKAVRNAAFTNDENYSLSGDSDGDEFDDYTTYFVAWANRPTDELNQDGTKKYVNDLDVTPTFTFYLNGIDITEELNGRYHYHDDDHDGLWELELSYKHASLVKVKVHFNSNNFNYRDAEADANFISLKGPYEVVMYAQGQDGLTINLTDPISDDDPIKTDTYYRVEIRDSELNDVTQYFIDTVRWRYFNPETSNEDDLPSWIKRCDSKAQFSTQITNNLNNDLNKDISGSLANSLPIVPTSVVNEQGLQLYIEFNPNKPRLSTETATNGQASRCVDFKNVK